MADQQPTPIANTRDEQELAMIRTVLTARGWTISDLRITATDLILIAAHPRYPTAAEPLPGRQIR